MALDLKVPGEGTLVGKLCHYAHFVQGRRKSHFIKLDSTLASLHAAADLSLF